MNKYIVPICDIEAGDIWIKTIIARSNSDCQEKIIEELIDLYDIEDNTLTVHMKRLRKVLGTYDNQTYIETLRGVGYRWKV